MNEVLEGNIPESSKITCFAEANIFLIASLFSKYDNNTSFEGKSQMINYTLYKYTHIDDALARCARAHVVGPLHKFHL